ncbi:MAG: mercury(II) reductase [Bauldia litoralis]
MSDCCKPGKSYDVAVIGAGSAGFSSAITAANEGARVALVGHGAIGGTCVNVGCVPSKALIRAVEPLYQASAASRFDGIEASARLVDWRKVRDQKTRLVEQLQKEKYADLLPTYSGIDYIEATASFSATGLQVDDKPFSADKVILATGSVERIPEIKGAAVVPYLTSTTAFELDALPASLLIVGGGYIGVEVAQMFARAGVDVTIVCRSRLLPEAEPEISEALEGYLREEGITVEGGLTYSAISTSGTGIRLDAERSGIAISFAAEQVLFAAGRSPNTASLNLDCYLISTEENGGILVNDRMQTTREGIYAAGDVTGRDQFVYMAAYGAKLAAKNALNGNALSYDNRAMPAVVFTDPQVASVGMTEAGAKAAGWEVKTSALTLDNVPRSLAARDTRGLVKLVADQGSGKLLGAHILAPEGAESIQTAALAIKAGMTYSDLAETIFPYLTTVESLKLAAQTFDMDIAKLSCCAG